MSAFFIISVKIGKSADRSRYDDYIQRVKPIVEKFGGAYLMRSEKISALSAAWRPDRVIIIEFASKQRIDDWLSSEEYRAIEGLRLSSVQAEAVIVESDPA